MRFPVRDKMPVDLRRVVLAAVQAALEDDQADKKKANKNKGLSGGRAVAVGAALVVAARVAAGPGGRFVRDRVQDRLASLTRDGGGEEEIDELEAEEYDEPEAEYEDVLEDEEYDEPEGDYDDEPEAEQDEEPEDEHEEEPVDEEYDEPEAEQDEEPVDEEYDEPEAEHDAEPEAEQDDEPEDEEYEEPEAKRGRKARPRPAGRPPRHSDDGELDDDAGPPPRPSRRRASVART
jgi:hypothetical protein